MLKRFQPVEKPIDWSATPSTRVSVRPVSSTGTRGLVLAIVAPRFKGNQFGYETPYFESLATEAQSRGHRFVIVHPGKFAKWNSGKALFSHEFDVESGQWASTPKDQRVNALDVVIRKYGPQESADKFRRLQTKVAFFNPYDIWHAVSDKLTFSELMHDANIGHPHTQSFELNDGKKLLELLGRHGRVFVKPKNGSLGRGIVYLARTTAGNVRVRYRIKEDDRYRFEYRTVNPAAAHSALLEAVSKLNSRNLDYVIQSAVVPQTYKSRPFSLRVVVHRRGDGQKVVGSQARIGDKDVFMVSSGLARPTEKVVSESLGIDGEELKQKIAEIHSSCLNAFRQVSKSVKQKHGKSITELGFDVILDRQGKPVIIEANFRPQVLPNEPLLNPGFVKNVVDTAESLARTKRRK